jgi:hypothetical protein
MNFKTDCIHLKCRFLKVLNLGTHENEQRPINDKCDLDLINSLWGCNPRCESYEVKQ